MRQSGKHINRSIPIDFYASFLGIGFYPLAGNQSRKLSDALAISHYCFRRGIVRPTVTTQRSTTRVVQIRSHCNANIWYSQFYRTQFDEELDRIEDERIDPCLFDHPRQRLEDLFRFSADDATVKLQSLPAHQFAHCRPSRINLVVFVRRYAWEPIRVRQIKKNHIMTSLPQLVSHCSHGIHVTG